MGVDCRNTRAWLTHSAERTERLDALGGVLMIGLGGVLAPTRRAP